jgi:hypothetical protein
MRYEPGKSFSWFMPYGRGYLAVFAYPGNKRTRYLRHPDGKPVQFDSYLEAIEAATLQVRRHCEPDIVATPAEDPLAKRLAEEAIEFRQRREDETRRLRSETFTMHKAGKKPVVVETKRRAG